MARRIVVASHDDIDGSPAVETVRFGLDGVSYEIDLSARNAAALRTALELYRSAGRRVGGVRKRSVQARRAASTRIDPAQLAAIREWARRRGLAVSERGRLPRSVVEQYNTAR
jgi:Lsr2